MWEEYMKKALKIFLAILLTVTMASSFAGCGPSGNFKLSYLQVGDQYININAEMLATYDAFKADCADGFPGLKARAVVFSHFVAQSDTLLGFAPRQH